MNKVVLIGRLTKDPELKYTPGTGTAVTTITLAVENYNSKTQEKTADFIQVVLWGKQAENTAQYTLKGSQVAISGRISVRTYDAKDGTKRYVTEVVADMFNGIQFLSKNNNSNSNNSIANNDVGAWNQSDDFGMGFGEEVPMDFGDMPF